jgi:hypothetical protein
MGDGQPHHGLVPTQLPPPAVLEARGCQLIARWARRHESDLTLTLDRIDAIAALTETHS